MKEFADLINSFLKYRIDYDEFYSQFNELYFGVESEERNKVLEPNEADLLDEINEKMFLVAKDPSEKDRDEYKYIDDREFSKWLAEIKKENINLWND